MEPGTTATYKEYDSENQVAVEYRYTEEIDHDTQEVVPVCVVTKRIYGGGAPFHKVWMQTFLESFGICQSKQVDIMCYVYEHTQPANNLFLGTYKSIAAALDVTEPTIAKIMKKMQEKDFIRRVQNGVWFINPAIFMQGSDRKRRMLVTKFENVGEVRENDAIMDRGTKVLPNP